MISHIDGSSTIAVGLSCPHGLRSLQDWRVGCVGQIQKLDLVGLHIECPHAGTFKIHTQWGDATGEDGC